MGKWVRVRNSDGSGYLYDVGINPDGTLDNPNGYPDDIVRTAVQAAEERRHKRRSAAAKKAAVTREERQIRRVYWAAARMLDGHAIGPSKNCAICGRGLGDTASIERGIGSECWQGVLSAITAVRRQRAAA